MSKVNDYQVGGNHYQGAKYQHWDIVADHNLNYFEAQILRYVMRCRKKKNMVEDLKKAKQFIEKYIELVEEGRIEDPTTKKPQEMHQEAMQKQYGVKPFESHLPDCVYPMRPCTCAVSEAPAKLASTI